MKIMFAKIYALPIWVMIFLAVAGTLLWILTGLLRQNRWIRGIQICLLLVVSFFVLYFTVTGRRTYPEQRISPVPFISFERAKIQPEIYRSMLLNCLMFQTFGLCLAWLLPQRWKTGVRVLTVIFSGLILSLIIETIQYFFALGIAETDDLICNTAGCAIAAGAMLLRDCLVRYRRKRDMSEKESNDQKPE